MTREPTLATLKVCAAEFARIYRNLSDDDQALPPEVRAYRAEIAPLRTRAEVDAEIVSLVRNRNVPGGYGFSSSQLDKLRELCREPTAPEAEPEPEPGWGRFVHNFSRRYKPAAQRCDEPEPNATTDPEPCSCDQSERLLRKLADIRKVCSSYQVSVCAGEVLRIIDEP